MRTRRTKVSEVIPEPTTFLPAVVRHCCQCADKEDTREISATVLSVAQAVVTEGGVGEVRNEAEALLIAAFKAEKRKHDAIGLPRL
jgi:hypothetical protein